MMQHDARRRPEFASPTPSLLLLLLSILIGVAAGATSAAAEAGHPAVTPATGGGGVPLIFGHFGDVDAIGYQTAEYFLEGEAQAYTASVPLSSDGRWDDVEPLPTSTAYKTRVVVHTPADPRRFDGTVYLEWLNVSGLVDSSPDWVHGHIQVARQGSAYVLVSAQAAGVSQLVNGGIAPGDPARYGSLSHPGDSYSYDIYSQAAQAVLDGGLLGGLQPLRLIAIGESQSAGRLTTYYNAVQPRVDLFAGFLIHSRQGGGAPLSQPPQDTIPVTLTTFRDDATTPVIVFQAEGDVARGQLLARQPETADGAFRLWEVAGTSHFDLYGLDIGLVDVGDGHGEIDNLAAMQAPPSAPQPGLIECALPINTGPMHWVFNAAVQWIDRWAKWGTAPPIAPRLEAQSLPGEPVVFEEDVHGNVVGGIRHPYVDVPIAKLAGTGNAGAPGAPPSSAFCFLFGQTVPFDAAKLDDLYPTHKHFVFGYLFAGLKAVNSRFLLWRDALALINAAALSEIGGN